ncbi:translin isoform X2 [Thunnus albacares]|uniref:translin isoform X2 n=1 Tax=Thunnus albacares TaxID=8236 RepID=UPI001CF6EC49|nr:translin isoform X2 [Thunnus albacares]
MSVTEMFSYIQGFLSADQDIREDIRKVVQVLEQTAREILTVLQSVHQPSGFKEIPSKCAKARELFCTVRTHIADLKTKFPVEQYYRFHEHWRFVLQRLAFLAAFVVYLETETLVTREEVAQILDITAGGKQRDSRRLQPTAPHLQLHQRAGLGFPTAQPEERPAAEALRWPQVRREEDRGGGVRPVHPRLGQGYGDRRGQVELGGGDWPWETEDGGGGFPGLGPLHGCCRSETLHHLEGKTQGSA